eukprot:324876-Alexandrium_andersonii.AAC.1
MQNDSWRAAVDRPMATAMQFIPKADVVVAEREWQERREGNKVVAISGFIKVPESQVRKIEGLSGSGG